MNKTKRNKTTFADWPAFRIILTSISTILAVIIITLSSLIIINIVDNNYGVAPTYLLWMFVCLGLMSLVVFLKKRTKISLIKCLTLVGIDIVLGIVVLFAKDNPFLFSLTAGAYCIAIVISRVFELIQDHSLRSIIMNALIIVLVVLIAIGVLTSPTNQEEQIQSVILIECIFIALVSFVEAMSIALAQLKFKVLFKIILSTFSLEVLFGLLVMIAAFSFAFMAVEPAITTYADALWYCFAVVTTIGFGDIAATTAMGRILTVILGLYGIVVVAVITSIVVNFYNETAGKRDQKEFKQIDESDN